jgi:hypothetical protein
LLVNPYLVSETDWSTKELLLFTISKYKFPVCLSARSKRMASNLNTEAKKRGRPSKYTSDVKKKEEYAKKRRIQRQAAGAAKRDNQFHQHYTVPPPPTIPIPIESHDAVPSTSGEEAASTTIAFDAPCSRTPALSDHNVPHVENDILEQLLPPLSPPGSAAAAELINYDDDSGPLLLDTVDNRADEPVIPTAPRRVCIPK